MPTLNAAECLPAAAAALRGGLTSGLVADLVVSTAAPRRRTLEIASALGATIVTGPPSAAASFAAGSPRPGESGSCSSIPTRSSRTDGARRCVTISRSNPREGRDFSRLAFRARGFGPAAVAGWINLRSLLFRLPCGAQGLLVSRAVSGSGGAGCPTSPLMEDVALARALGGRLRSLPATARVFLGGTIRARGLAEAEVSRNGNRVCPLPRRHTARAAGPGPADRRLTRA